MDDSLTPSTLRCEYRTNPIGLDERQPRLSWQVTATARNQYQAAYQILVASSAERLARGQADVWDSGKVASQRTTQIVYEGAPLISRQRCWWAVRVWNAAGMPSAFSAPAFWEMGLLEPSDWQAQWIALPQRPLATNLPIDLPAPLFPPGPLTLPAVPHFRTTFALPQGAQRARLYATAQGVYELRLNGVRVSDAVLAPGWTDYRQRILYQTYDVTDLLVPGDNVLGGIVADGWYSGYVGYEGKREQYGTTPRLLAQLHIEDAEGMQHLICTDATWRAMTGPILAADLLQGEHVDARRSWPGWDRADYDDADWHPVTLAADTTQSAPRLVADMGPPVRVTQEITPTTIQVREPHTYLIDFGQNVVGWVRLHVRASAGQRIVLRFSEMLDEGGDLYRMNLRGAAATDSYIAAGREEEVFEPRFTFHGFRYCEVSGYPGTLTAGDITACVVESDTPTAGTFACSNELVNQLYRNIVWGQRGNFLSVPTDCPQRDERLGWLGDAQIFAWTAAYNRDVASFFTKWLADVTDAQSADGAFSNVAPRVVVTDDGTPGWGDAGILIPWMLYRMYGDTRIVDRMWSAMTRWMHYIGAANPDGLWRERRNADLGDWLAVDRGNSQLIETLTPKDLLATAYYAYDAQAMAQMARGLGKMEEARHYDALCAHIQRAFVATFVHPDGRISGDTQTAYALALMMDVLPAELRQAAAHHLVAAIKRHNGHLTTGFLGVRALLPALSATGHLDVAYRLLLNDTYPSWGYTIRQGATTIWERWDGWTEERGFQDPGMNSFNHYSLGSVGEWLFQTVAGLDCSAASNGEEHPYHVRIAPQPGGGITSAHATYASLSGHIAVRWHWEDTDFHLAVTIPTNVAATIQLPFNHVVTERGMPLHEHPDIGHIPTHGNSFHVGSGEYHFIVADALQEVDAPDGLSNSEARSTP